MEVEISYEEAQARYPQQVAEIIANLRKGKSVQKNADPATLKYKLMWGEQMQAYSFNDLLHGNVTRTAEPNSWEEYWQGVQSRVKMLSLHGSLRRWWGWAETKITEHPQEVYAFYKTAYAKIQNEKARQAALTPAQKQQEFDNTLNILKSATGFYSIRYPVQVSSPLNKDNKNE